MEPRKKRRLIGRIVGIVLGVAVIVLIGLGFVPKPVPVMLGKVERRALEVTVDEPGRTRVRSRYVVSAPALGQLARIALRAGDAVQADAVLAELSPITPQLLDSRTRAEAAARVSVAQANVVRTRSAIQAAETTLQFARDQAARMRKLHAESGASQQALEKAEYDERSAQQALENARVGERVAQAELITARTALASMEGGSKQSSKLLVRAPVAGVVLKVIQESEGVVQLGAPLLELGDPSTLEIVVDLLSTDAVRIRRGAQAHIDRWGGDTPLKARVRTIEPAAFTTRSALGVEEQRVPVVLDLSDPRERWQALGDGYRVETRIQVQRIESALVVPASALFREDGKYCAFVTREDRVAKVTVETGAHTPDWIETKAGLKLAERVVLYPSDQVSHGVKIVAQASAPR